MGGHGRVTTVGCAAGPLVGEPKDFPGTGNALPARFAGGIVEAPIRPGRGEKDELSCHVDSVPGG
jgi:hypothetical protein